MLPNEITIETSNGNRTVKVHALTTTGVPNHDGGALYSYRLENAASWDGHTKSWAKSHLTTWTFPEKVTEIARRTEDALSEGIPDQKRKMLRNQPDGDLDDQWIDEIAIGEEIENPFCRWSKLKRKEVRVAICLDAATTASYSAEFIRARTAIAAGLTSALESLSYDVSVTAACLLALGKQRGSRRGRRVPDPRYRSEATVHGMVLKSEDEPMVDSGFSHYADTGFQRLVKCWTKKGTARSTPLTDGEWRDLTEADFYIYIGTDRTGGSHPAKNTGGLPYEATIGLDGEDVLRLRVDSYNDIDIAIEKIESFFEGVL